MVAGGLFLLAACVQPPHPPQSATPTAPTPPVTAEAAPVRTLLGPPSALPGFTADAAALTAFRRACPALGKRVDRSGLTRPEDWAAACADPEADPAAFFARHFTAVRLNDGQGLMTGYYEPEIAACVTPAGACRTAIHALPPDLVEIPLGPFMADLTGRSIRGRWDGQRFLPYASRAEIEAGALDGRGLELAYTADPIGLFFLHIQGSGLLRYPDGSLHRIGYAGQNGHAYVPIGRLLRQRNLVQGPIGMAEIRAWLAANPDEGKALMRENPSYIFLRRLAPELDGPPGAMGVPLIPRANAAIDAETAPLGTPIFIDSRIDGQPVRQLVIAADTGGAIRGANRLDLFFGPGPEAARLAGALQSPLSATLLLPNAAAQRLTP